MFTLDDYDYDLPDDCIAQKPSVQRDQSRLLHLNRQSGKATNYVFSDLKNIISPGDVLVINNTEVIPGRLIGRKETGGKAEILILTYSKGQEARKASGEFTSTCLIKSTKKPKIGSFICFDHGLRAEVLGLSGENFLVKFTCDEDFDEILYKIGKVPLPPYIKRETESSEDKTMYQTIYASQKGAIAAPTAGFHFSENLLSQLEAIGVKIVQITLHIGYGTFVPVRVSDIRNHQMHSETYSITTQASDIINDAKAGGARIVAVGTTSVRSLEFAASEDGRLSPGSGECDLYIYPGYRFKIVDAMITNFHLPKSTLLMLVSAFAGRDLILNSYKQAIQNGYRFYSYGDAMLIE